MKSSKNKSGRHDSEDIWGFRNFQKRKKGSKMKTYKFITAPKQMEYYENEMINGPKWRSPAPASSRVKKHKSTMPVINITKMAKRIRLKQNIMSGIMSLLQFVPWTVLPGGVILFILLVFTEKAFL